MNKKDISEIRRQFKLNNNALQINNIFNVYVRKESNEIYHHVNQAFGMLDLEKQELFLDNFKKVLGGQLDRKLFNVKFDRELENSSQTILYESLLTQDDESWNEGMLKIVDKIFSETTYEFDVVVTFIRGKYYKAAKVNPDDDLENDLETTLHDFILCSLNKTELPKTELLFDFIEREFKSDLSVDPVINLRTPLGGFLFPTFTRGFADVNHILYSAGRVNKPDFTFIHDVLNGEDIVTALEDKFIFEEVVKDIVGEEVDTRTLANVYEEINRYIEEEEEEENEEAILDYKDIHNVLEASGVEDLNPIQVEMALKKVVDNNKHEFKATNIIPNYNRKSIKINTKVANIAVSPNDLRYVKQVELDGKRFLMIEVDEETEIESFKLIPEA